MEQTAYEKVHKLVPRDDLMNNVLSLMKDLDESQFHHIYALIWEMSAKELLHRLQLNRYEDKEKEYETEVKKRLSK